MCIRDRSNINFEPVDKKTISFGLNAIKNVGVKALEQIISARDSGGTFQSIFDFTSRVHLQAVNKKVLESLIMSGAMDHIEGSRAEKYSSIDIAIRYGQNVQSEKNKNQVDLFGGSSSSAGVSMVPNLQEVRPWPDKESLDKEKEVLGLYLTGHPLFEYADDLEDFSNHDFSEKVNSITSSNIRIGGSIQNLKIHYDRKNNQMAFFTLECLGDLHSLSKLYPGKCNLMFHYNDQNNRKKRILSHNIRVSSSREYLTKLRDKCGKKNVWVE